MEKPSVAKSESTAETREQSANIEAEEKRLQANIQKNQELLSKAWGEIDKWKESKKGYVPEGYRVMRAYGPEYTPDKSIIPSKKWERIKEVYEKIGDAYEKATEKLLGTGLALGGGTFGLGILMAALQNNPGLSDKFFLASFVAPLAVLGSSMLGAGLLATKRRKEQWHAVGKEFEVNKK